MIIETQPNNAVAVGLQDAGLATPPIREIQRRHGNFPHLRALDGSATATTCDLPLRKKSRNLAHL